MPKSVINSQMSKGSVAVRKQIQNPQDFQATKSDKKSTRGGDDGLLEQMQEINSLALELFENSLTAETMVGKKKKNARSRVQKVS